MGKKRYSVQDIAEVLIDKLGDMERTAKQIEAASNKVVKIDTSELKKILEDNQKAQKRILSDLESLKEKNKARLPNWVLGVLLAFFLSFFGGTLYLIFQAEKYDDMRLKSEHFEKKYLDLHNNPK